MSQVKKEQEFRKKLAAWGKKRRTLSKRNQAAAEKEEEARRKLREAAVTAEKKIRDLLSFGQRARLPSLYSGKKLELEKFQTAVTDLAKNSSNKEKIQAIQERIAQADKAYENAIKEEDKTRKALEAHDKTKLGRSPLAERVKQQQKERYAEIKESHEEMPLFELSEEEITKAIAAMEERDINEMLEEEIDLQSVATELAELQEQLTEKNDEEEWHDVQDDIEEDKKAEEALTDEPVDVNKLLEEEKIRIEEAIQEGREEVKEEDEDREREVDFCKELPGTYFEQILARVTNIARKEQELKSLDQNARDTPAMQALSITARLAITTSGMSKEAYIAGKQAEIRKLREELALRLDVYKEYQREQNPENFREVQQQISLKIKESEISVSLGIDVTIRLREDKIAELKAQVGDVDAQLESMRAELATIDQETFSDWLHSENIPTETFFDVDGKNSNDFPNKSILSAGKNNLRACLINIALEYSVRNGAAKGPVKSRLQELMDNQVQYDTIQTSILQTLNSQSLSTGVVKKINTLLTVAKDLTPKATLKDFHQATQELEEQNKKEHGGLFSSWRYSIFAFLGYKNPDSLKTIFDEKTRYFSECQAVGNAIGGQMKGEAHNSFIAAVFSSYLKGKGYKNIALNEIKNAIANEDPNVLTNLLKQKKVRGKHILKITNFVAEIKKPDVNLIAISENTPCFKSRSKSKPDSLWSVYRTYASVADTQKLKTRFTNNIQPTRIKNQRLTIAKKEREKFRLESSIGKIQDTLGKLNIEKERYLAAYRPKLVDKTDEYQYRMLLIAACIARGSYDPTTFLLRDDKKHAQADALLDALIKAGNWQAASQLLADTLSNNSDTDLDSYAMMLLTELVYEKGSGLFSTGSTLVHEKINYFNQQINAEFPQFFSQEDEKSEAKENKQFDLKTASNFEEFIQGFAEAAKNGELKEELVSRRASAKAELKNKMAQDRLNIQDLKTKISRSLVAQAEKAKAEEVAKTAEQAAEKAKVEEATAAKAKIEELVDQPIELPDEVEEEPDEVAEANVEEAFEKRKAVVEIESDEDEPQSEDEEEEDAESLPEESPVAQRAASFLRRVTSWSLVLISWGAAGVGGAIVSGLLPISLPFMSAALVAGGFGIVLFAFPITSTLLARKMSSAQKTRRGAGLFVLGLGITATLIFLAVTEAIVLTGPFYFAFITATATVAALSLAVGGLLILRRHSGDKELIAEGNFAGDLLNVVADDFLTPDAQPKAVPQNTHAKLLGAGQNQLGHAGADQNACNDHHDEEEHDAANDDLQAAVQPMQQAAAPQANHSYNPFDEPNPNPQTPALAAQPVPQQSINPFAPGYVDPAQNAAPAGQRIQHVQQAVAPHTPALQQQKLSTPKRKVKNAPPPGSNPFAADPPKKGANSFEELEDKNPFGPLPEPKLVEPAGGSGSRPKMF